jgi:hypothetical protein
MVGIVLSDAGKGAAVGVLLVVVYCLSEAVAQRAEVGAEGVECGEAKKSEYSGIITIDEAAVSSVIPLIADLEKNIDEALMKGTHRCKGLLRVLRPLARAMKPSARTPSSRSLTQKSP